MKHLGSHDQQLRALSTPIAPSDVDFYHVGFVSDLLFWWHSPHEHKPDARRRLLRTAHANWRRRSYWNGYLAEPLVDGGWTRCGHGWSRGRAWDDLIEHMRKVARES